jgi:hypothetical protein
MLAKCERLRVLHIGHERFFCNHFLVDEVFIPTGRRWSEPKEGEPDRLSASGWGEMICSLLKGVDYVFIAGVNFTDRYQNDNLLKAKLRSVAKIFFRFPFVSGLLKCFLFKILRARAIAVLDRNDQVEHFNGFNIKGKNVLFFKHNAIPDNHGFCPEFLPYFISIRSHNSPFDSNRDIDALFIGEVAIHEKVRNDLREICKDLKNDRELSTFFHFIGGEDGGGRIEYQQYMDLCARASLILSPEGAGWHCFRHYEALLQGSIPVINAPPIGLKTDLRHGENCFFYSSAQELKSIVRDFAQDRLSVAMNEEERISQVKMNHTHESVGMFIIKALEHSLMD